MILSHCIMMRMAFYQGHPPHHPIPSLVISLQYLNGQSVSACNRIKLLDDMVVLNAGTLAQYQKLKMNTMLDFLSMRTVTEKQTHRPLTTTDPKVPEETTKEIKSSFDPFGMHEITHVQHFVDCTARDTELDQLLSAEYNSSNGPTVLQSGMSDAAFQMLASDPHALVSIRGSAKHAVIFDTGASLGITFDREDFDGPLTIPDGDLRLGGMAQGLKIEGVGPVNWTLTNTDGSELTIRSQCYYVPEAKVRLLSPQRLFNKSKGVTGKYAGDEDTFTLEFEGCHRLIVEYDHRNHLPIGYAIIGTPSPTINPQANITLLDESNQNITAGHKLLMNWHSRFGHLNFPAVQ
jgi:hypothetical protein